VAEKITGDVGAIKRNALGVMAEGAAAWIPQLLEAEKQLDARIATLGSQESALATRSSELDIREASIVKREVAVADRCASIERTARDRLDRAVTAENQLKRALEVKQELANKVGELEVLLQAADVNSARLLKERNESLAAWGLLKAQAQRQLKEQQAAEAAQVGSGAPK